MILARADARSLPLPTASVNLVVTSPPYFGIRNYATPGEIGREATVGAYVAEVLAVMLECARTLTDDGSLFVVIGDKYVADNRGSGGDRKRTHKHAPAGPEGFLGREVTAKGGLLGLPYRVALAAVDAGLLWRQDIVWHKPNPTPDPVVDRCSRTREAVLHFIKSRRYYTSNGERSGLGGDVWSIPVQGYGRHPAVYPEALVSRIVTGWSRPGDVVMDPFVGSGTTAVVARGLGRRAVGFDANESFLRIAANRAG